MSGTFSEDEPTSDRNRYYATSWTSCARWEPGILSTVSMWARRWLDVLCWLDCPWECKFFECVCENLTTISLTKQQERWDVLNGWTSRGRSTKTRCRILELRPPLHFCIKTTTFGLCKSLSLFRETSTVENNEEIEQVWKLSFFIEEWSWFWVV